MTGSKVRVRYAPSPTGEPHLGNLRTALFDWLFARSLGGEFIVREEDTDQARKIDEAMDLQKLSLNWLGLDWDEGLGKDGKYGPYVQSRRLDYYQKIAQNLLENNKAYKCYCSSERLQSLREEQKKNKSSKLGYDGHCKNSDEDIVDKSYVIRFAMPLEGISAIDDAVRGHVEFPNQDVDDFILIKSDGFPTYHLASVVDDHYMDITHVFRGEEWLPSVPRHIQLYKSLGWEPPIYAHLPYILAPDKSKLSKRHGATSVLDYKEKGYIPDAMVNFLSLLGWSLDGETEIISRDQIINHFSIDRVNDSGAVFDIEKLDWMNGYYLRRMDVDKLADCLYQYWSDYPPEELDRIPSIDETKEIVILIQERIKTLKDAAPFIAFLFKDEIVYTATQLIQKGLDLEETKNILNQAVSLLNNIDDFWEDNIEESLRTFAKENNIKLGHFLGSIRFAITAQDASPQLFKSIEILGKDLTLFRLDQAIQTLNS
ncbi:MAG: glutamate--tRNA ligase [SAR202 cluster bacterium]|nr:glutamate--tRNA ligase [Chloroflexota bacterium]MQG22771.1 glutamate--tRNA ligase [SAR202 cluster bacterium]